MPEMIRQFYPTWSSGVAFGDEARRTKMSNASGVSVSAIGRNIMIDTKIATSLVALGLLCAGASPVISQEAQEVSAANDTAGFAEAQAYYEYLRDDGLFTSALEGELAYYYSEQVPVSTEKVASKSGDESEVTTFLTDCSKIKGFPSAPKFLYGGLDPIAMVASAERNRVRFPDLDAPYANFFAASGRSLGVCEHYTVLPIKTGEDTFTQYVVLFQDAVNKDAFESAFAAGNAPMPAVGFWCMWGLGNGSSPHFAVPNNPQYAVYDVSEEAQNGLELDSTIYIGANYWPRTHGMGSPNVIGQLVEFFEEVDAGTAFWDEEGQFYDPANIRVLRARSVIFHDPLAR
jgi:hypothetical protein